MIKICTKCIIEKNISEFSKDKSKKDNLQSYCKVCDKKRSKKYYQNNKEKIKARVTEYYKENRKKQANNIKKWRQDNPDKHNANNAKRRASKLQRTPSWANLNLIEAFYTEAQRLTKETGTLHHVDHILPLQGYNVSGLHVENNLQILTATENLTKSNKY